MVAGSETTAIVHPIDDDMEGGAAGQRRRPSCLGRCRISCTRALEKEYCGATVPQLAALVGNLVLPIMDTVSDWAVTLSFYQSGDVGWFRAGLSIQIFSGLFAGMLSSIVFAESVGSNVGCKRGWCTAIPLGLTVGLLGLGPVVLAALTLRDGNAVGGMQMLKGYKLCELIFESLPASTLQSYVGVAYGRFNPADEDFSYLLPVSVCISMLGAGTTLFSVEADNRHDDGLKLSMFSRYGLVVVVNRAANTAALVFWVAQLTCAVKGYAAAAMVIVICGFGCIAMEGTTREGGAKGQGPRFWAVCSCLCFVLMAGAMAAVFLSVDHLENNYGNASMPLGVPGDPQHYDCLERTSGWYPAVAATVTSCILTPLGWLIDPQLGVTGCRGKNRDEQIAHEKSTMTEDEVQTAMLNQVWRWADVYRDDSLEPGEIYRLARAVKIGTAQSFLPKDVVEEYEGIAEALGVGTLTHDQIFYGQPVNILKVREASITRKQFVERMMGDGCVQQWFDALLLPLSKKKRSILEIVCNV